MLKDHHIKDADERRAFWNRTATLAVEDDEAFTLLYQEFFPVVYKFLLSKTGNTDMTEEAVSRTFLNVHAHLAEYDESRGAFSTWLFRIAINELRMMFRKSQQSLDTSWEEGFDPPAPEHETPERVMLRKEREQQLLDAVTLLPRREQEILKFTYWLGFSAEEVADALGMTKDAVWASLSRSRKALKQYLEKNEKNKEI